MNFIKQYLPYVSFGAAVIILAVFVLGYIDNATMLIGLSIFGFTGVGSLRSWVDAQGWKTYFFLAIGVVGLIAYVFKWIDQQMFQYWLSAWGLISGATIADAVNKVRDSI